MVIDRHYPIITVYVMFVSKKLSFYERIRCFDILMWCLRILNQIAYISLFPFLTHGGRETLICVRKLNPDWFRWWLGDSFRRRAGAWTSAYLMAIGSQWMNFSEIKMKQFPLAFFFYLDPGALTWGGNGMCASVNRIGFILGYELSSFWRQDVF